jgi:hypothetical protein
MKVACHLVDRLRADESYLSIFWCCGSCLPGNVDDTDSEDLYNNENPNFVVTN